jgi:hypothetical protein
MAPKRDKFFFLVATPTSESLNEYLTSARPNNASRVNIVTRVRSVLVRLLELILWFGKNREIAF